MNPKIAAIFISILSICSLSITSFSQAPSNDECSGAIEIMPDSGPVSANNSNTLIDGPEPGCGGTGIKDVWYYFIFPGGNVVIQTALGTNTDTRIGLYHSCGGTVVACNDDSGGYASLLTATCTDFETGDTCIIQAGGFNATAGTFSITVTTSTVLGCTDESALNYNPCANLDDGTCENATAPANDLCENAVQLLINGPFVLANNTLATSSGANPSCGNLGTNNMLDLWYYFVHDGTELDINVSAGTLIDTRLAVYNSCGGQQVACDDDAGPGNAAFIHFDCGDLIEGTTYYLRVGGYGALTGNFYVNVNSTNTCVLGASCDVPYGANIGLNDAPVPNTWFAFTPPQNGQWRISTCNLNTCDTKIWIYDYCTMANFDDSNAATYTYNDDFCGVQAEITPMLAGNATYYLRIGDTGMACGSDTIHFNIEYMGPVVGCMDVNACNYSAVAEVEAPCYYNDDPNCDGLGPDLEIEGTVLYNSLYSTTINGTDACLVNEGCLQGIGNREILRFSTHIKNIGNQDYFIGVPSAGNPQFEWDLCHNHYHYEGYAEYLLFDQDGNSMPQIGFKNGFCVLDLECSGGGVAKFGCGNMGITAGCGDIYNSGLACQWIDVTDVPAGDYFLVVRTNWDQSPDNAGHYEQRYDNNVVQVCIHFDRDANNNLINFTKDINACSPVLDCLDIPFGDNQPDCEGTCPGITKRGDVVSDGVLNESDVHHYVESTIDGSVLLTECSDLNSDGAITVTDAVMLEACIHGQEEQGIPDNEIGDCPYDNEIINPNHTTTIGIAEVNLEENYVDVYVLNPDKEIKGIEFEVSGINIQNVEALTTLMDWDIDMAYANGGVHFSAIGHEPTFMPKFSVPTSVLRFYYSAITNDQVCISNIIDVVNLDNHNTLTVIGDCQSMVIPLLANFSADMNNGCEEMAVNFTDTSLGAITGYSWTFEGGDPLTSSDQNPTVVYHNEGIYSVTLTIESGATNNSYTQENFILVLANNTWYFDGDHDGFGIESQMLVTCGELDSYSLVAGDCDDNDPGVYPNAPGLGSDVDNNCDGNIDGTEASVCVCDINGDGMVNIPDLLILTNEFGCISQCAADLNNDQMVSTTDVQIFMGCFGSTCGP